MPKSLLPSFDVSSPLDVAASNSQGPSSVQQSPSVGVHSLSQPLVIESQLLKLQADISPSNIDDDGIVEQAVQLRAQDTQEASHQPKSTFTLEDMHPMLHQVFDQVIQWLCLPAYVKKTQKGQKNLHFIDGTTTSLNSFLVQQGITLEDIFFMSPLGGM